MTKDMNFRIESNKNCIFAVETLKFIKTVIRFRFIQIYTFHVNLVHS